MANCAADYKLIGIRADRSVVETRVSGAPSSSRLFNWAKRKDCIIVGRYYPSRRRWEAFDLRHAHVNSAGWWMGAAQIARTWPTDIAMAMEIITRMDV